jgi:hypothetical protein
MRLLVKKIYEVFQGNKYPGDDNIATKQIDYDLESLSDFVGMDWRDIDVNFLCPPSRINKHSDSLCFMTPAAYAYFFPAYMVVSITDYKRSDQLPDNLIYHLTLPLREDDERDLKFYNDRLDDDNIDMEEKELMEELKAECLASDGSECEQMRQFFMGRASQFSAAQSAVIKQFLEYMQKRHGGDFLHNEPQVAIDRYWGKF